MMSPTQAGRDAAATMVGRKPAPARAASGPARAPIERAQDTLPGPLRAVPLQALLAAAGLAITTAIVVSAGFVRNEKAIEALEDDGPPAAIAPAATTAAHTGAPSAVPDGRKAPTASELDAARIGGAASLRTLAQRFPEDPAVLQALAIAEARDNKAPAAVDILRHLLDVAPSRAADKDVQAVLLEIASGPPDRAPEAFALLETRMGTYGPDMLYELRERTSGSKATKDRAAESLAKPEVLKLASRALRIAEDLRAKQGCDRKELFPRAAAEGDHRALPLLKPLLETNCGGGFPFFKARECFTCFKAADRKDIAAAIAAIEKRDGGAH